MSLSCTCDFEWDGEGWFWVGPTDFSELKASRRKRCVSCKCLIDIGSQCVEFQRFRGPQSEIEESIIGEDGEVQMASWYHCEKCGEQYLNFDALGYCIDLERDNMLDLLKEYQGMTGFVRAEEAA